MKSGSFPPFHTKVNDHTWRRALAESSSADGWLMFSHSQGLNHHHLCNKASSSSSFPCYSSSSHYAEGALSRREAAALRCSGMTVAGKDKVCQASPVACCQAIAKHCSPSRHTVQETLVIHSTETGLNHFL